MLLDPMGGIVITNDGNCILREVDVSHPTAKSMIELSRAQDEEVGDGTTSVIILAGEMLILAEPLIHDHLHPTVIVQGYNRALQEALEICERMALKVDVLDTDRMKKLVQSCIGTKFSSRWTDKMVEMALQAVLTVARVKGNTPEQSGASNPYNHKMEVDIKRYAKVEKIPGGEISDSIVLKGVMFNKDTTHSKMRRRIEKPRILLLDCPLEYKKGESQTNVEITNTDDWNTMLRMEEEYVENMCMEIIAFQPDIVITEKGVSDLAQHYLAKANITAFRRLRKTDNNRVARATGATIVSRTDEIQESDIGTGCGLFDMKKIGDEVRDVGVITTMLVIYFTTACLTIHHHSGSASLTSAKTQRHALSSSAEEAKTYSMKLSVTSMTPWKLCVTSSTTPNFSPVAEQLKWLFQWDCVVLD